MKSIDFEVYEIQRVRSTPVQHRSAAGNSAKHLQVDSGSPCFPSNATTARTSWLRRKATPQQKCCRYDPCKDKGSWPRTGLRLDIKQNSSPFRNHWKMHETNQPENEPWSIGIPKHPNSHIAIQCSYIPCQSSWNDLNKHMQSMHASRHQTGKPNTQKYKMIEVEHRQWCDILNLCILYTICILEYAHSNQSLWNVSVISSECRQGSTAALKRSAYSEDSYPDSTQKLPRLTGWQTVNGYRPKRGLDVYWRSGFFMIYWL